MPPCRIWLRYVAAKMHAATDFVIRRYEEGRIKPEEMFHVALRNVFIGHLTFVHSYKGKEMAPTFSSENATLLVRPSLGLTERQVHVGDVVLFKDPKDADNLLVRRIAARAGEEMLSRRSRDKPFDLEEGQFWVLSDNEGFSPKDAVDSRTFGPLDSDNVLGRAIYYYVSQENNGIVKNSPASVALDFPLLAAELDIETLKMPPVRQK